MKKSNAEIPQIGFAQSQINGFEIMPLELLFKRMKNVKDHDPYAPHRVNFFMIMIISSGQGSHFIDFKNYRFKEKSILFIAKDQVHSFSQEENAKGFLIIFTEQFLNENLVVSRHLSESYIYNYLNRNPVITNSEERFFILADLMNQEYTFPDKSNSAEAIRYLLHLFLLKAESITREKFQGSIHPNHLILFDRFNDFLLTNYSQTRNVKDYAEHLNISYQHLNSVCKEIRGITAKEYVDEFITLEIKRYLAGTNLSNKEICYRVGFDEPTNLSKFFKKNSGFTLNEFKNIYSYQPDSAD